MDRKKHGKMGKVGLMSLTILTALMFVFVSVVLANPEGVLDANFDFDWQGDASGEALLAYTEQESNVLSGPWNYLYGRSVLTECERQNTEIVFYEKAGVIKVCIRALSPEVQGIIESGSISMSISEEYDLDYFTGLAYGIRAEGPYRYLNPGMNKIEKSALFLSGFIPGLGPGFGIVQYVDDMKDLNEFDWYEQWDMTLDSSQPCMYIARDYFESNEALNTRDIAVIPWYKPPIYVLPFSEVVVYPPSLPVQEYQSDNIAFRVEYTVSSCPDNKGMLNPGKRIRLDVLIPIEIGYTHDWIGFVEEIRDEEVETVEEIIEEISEGEIIEEITATPKPTP